MARVNPPPQLKIPARFLKDVELRRYFEQRDYIQFQLWTRSGGGVDIINENIIISNRAETNSQARINEINEKIGSGDSLTSDETGFTVDSTKLTVDMTEA